jgi:DNA-binding transcriptional regulator LsrR (DeoR family)
MPEPSPHFQNNELMRLAAEQMGGTPHFIHAPYLPSEAARPALLADPSVKEAVALWDRVDVALVGIGLPWAVDRAQGGTAATPADPALSGAAGDVLQRYVDGEGRLMPWAGDARLVMMSPQQLRRAPLVIGVAAGPVKAAGIVGAARAGLVGALVTDARTAEAVLAAVG